MDIIDLVTTHTCFFIILFIVFCSTAFVRKSHGRVLVHCYSNWTRQEDQTNGRGKRNEKAKFKVALQKYLNTHSFYSVDGFCMCKDEA